MKQKTIRFSEDFAGIEHNEIDLITKTSNTLDVWLYKRAGY